MVVEISGPNGLQIPPPIGFCILDPNNPTNLYGRNGGVKFLFLFLQMSYLPVVWAGLFAYLGTSAGTCSRMGAEGSRLCAKCPVSIARGVLPATCTAAMRRSIGEVIRKVKVVGD